METLEQRLEKAEGRRKFVYRCPAGFLTIGVGRNLETVGLSDDEIDYLKANDIKRVRAELSKLMFYNDMPDNVKMVLEEMCFNLGYAGLSKFKIFFGCLMNREWERASVEMLDSLWAEQVGDRAIELSNIIKNTK